MKDREFINNLIKVYFSNAKEPHQAILDNAIINRLNDIVDKLENQEKVLKIIKEKGIDIGWLEQCETVEKYNYHCEANQLTEEEFDLLKRYCKR